MATIKKPAKKMQEGGKVKIKIKIKPDRKQAREANEQMSFQKNSAFEADKAIKDTGFNKAKAMKKGGVVKAKNGKSFPDLNKDGKITKADILKGRGVIAKSGAKLKKQAAVAIAMKKAGKTPKKMQYGGAAASMVPPMMKKGGTMKKCKYGCK
jgi:hypothetical protein